MNPFFRWFHRRRLAAELVRLRAWQRDLEDQVRSGEACLVRVRRQVADLEARALAAEPSDALLRRAGAL